MGLKAQKQVPRLGGRSLYPLSHLEDTCMEHFLTRLQVRFICFQAKNHHLAEVCMKLIRANSSGGERKAEAMSRRQSQESPERPSWKSKKLNKTKAYQLCHMSNLLNFQYYLKYNLEGFGGVSA